MMHRVREQPWQEGAGCVKGLRQFKRMALLLGWLALLLGWLAPSGQNPQPSLQPYVTFFLHTPLPCALLYNPQSTFTLNSNNSSEQLYDKSPHPTFTENTEAHRGLLTCRGTPASYSSVGVDLASDGLKLPVLFFLKHSYLPLHREAFSIYSPNISVYIKGHEGSLHPSVYFYDDGG